MQQRDLKAIVQLSMQRQEQYARLLVPRKRELPQQLKTQQNHQANVCHIADNRCKMHSCLRNIYVGCSHTATLGTLIEGELQREHLTPFCKKSGKSKTKPFAKPVATPHALCKR